LIKWIKQGKNECPYCRGQIEEFNHSEITEEINSNNDLEINN